MYLFANFKHNVAAITPGVKRPASIFRALAVDGRDPGVAIFMGYTPEETPGCVLFFIAGNFIENTNDMVSALFAAAHAAS